MLQIKTLGHFAVNLNDEPLQAQLPAKGQALLVYLACHTGQAISRSHLRTLLWSDSNNRRAAASLRQTLKRVRNVLPDEERLIVTRNTICFNPEIAYQLDVEGLDHDLSLYNGSFLEGFDLLNAEGWEEWLYVQREALELKVLSQLDTRVEQAVRVDKLEEAVGHAQRILALNPWREATHCQLMEIYMRMDNRAAAIVQYESCQQVLRDELDVEPSAETTALYERILGMSSQGLRHNLPIAGQLTRFFGREQELAEIEERLRQPDCRLLSVVGLGGVGKTRLAIEVGRRFAHHFVHGVWLVFLERVTPEGGIAAAIANALDLTLNPQASATTQLISYTHDKQMLLVVDNFEHLLDQASVLTSLLAAAPGLKCLVTSRTRLNVQLEWEYSLEGLPYENEIDNSSSVNVAAIELFEYSAQRVCHNFCLSAENTPAVQQICRLVGGLPLGIKLAAGWVRLLAPVEIVAEIVHDLEILQTQMRDVPERQRSLQAILAASWAMLNKAERTILNNLSVFPSHFDRQAARAVAGASLFQLLTLVDKSLLYTVEAQTGTLCYALHPLVHQYAAEQLEASGQHVQVRDRHLEYFVALLAKEPPFYHFKITPERLKQWQRERSNVLSAWQWLIERRDVAAFTRAYDGIFWTVEGLSIGNEPIQPLLQQTITLMRQAGESIALVRLLNGYCMWSLVNSRMIEFMQYSNEVMLLLDKLNAQLCANPVNLVQAELIWAEQAWCQQMQSMVALYLSDFNKAKEQAKMAVELWEKVGQPLLAANAGILLAMADLLLGNLASIRAHCDAYLSFRDKRPERAMLESGDIMPFCEITLDAVGEYDAAHQLLAGVISKHSTKTHFLYPVLLMHAGYNAYLRGNMATAQAWLHQSIATFRTWDKDQSNLAWGLGYLSEVELAAGNAQTAHDCCTEALALFRTIYLQWQVSWTLTRLGHAQLALGELDAAHKSFAEAERMAQSLKCVPFQLYAQLGQARQAIMQEAYEQASTLLRVIAEHPSTFHYHRQDAQRLLAQLENKTPL